jgi:hypothetical protein
MTSVMNTNCNLLLNRVCSKTYPGDQSWVPHISLVFREMWDTTKLYL